MDERNASSSLALPPYNPDSPDSSPKLAPSLADLRGAALSCLLALYISPQPAKSNWLRQISGYGRDALWSGIHTLVRFGLARYDPGARAWMITGTGIEFITLVGWLSGNGSCSPEKPAAAQVAAPNPPEYPETAPMENASCLPENPDAAQDAALNLPENPEAAQDAALNLPENSEAAHGFPVEQATEMSPLKDLRERDSKINIIDFSLSPDLDSSGLSPISQEQPEKQAGAEGQAQLDIARLLKCTCDLFGEPMLGAPASYQDPERLLAVIAETYDNRHQLDKPARVAYKAYQNGRNPPKYFWQKPSNYLPEDFVAKVGLPPPDKYSGWANPPVNEAIEAQPRRNDPMLPADRHPAPAVAPIQLSRSIPSLLPPPPPDCCAPGIDPELAECWYRSLLGLMHNMKLADYRRYVTNLILVDSDLAAGLYTVGSQDADHKAWLEYNLRSKLEIRMWMDLRKAVRVRFIVWPEAGDG